MGDKPRILIVGAGIAGLTLAAGLARQGITPAIAEIADGLLTRGLGLFLTSNVFLALRRIGLDKAVIERGVVIEQQIQTDAAERLPGITTSVRSTRGTLPTSGSRAKV
jgi:2-polyprenyl-6-methoxyphenol hydroxylase-like FAD-dependent oxidoreductase